LYKNASEGIHRINWNLRYKNPGSVNLKDEKFDPTKDGGSGLPAIPGKYTVELSMFAKGETTALAGPVTFEAKVLNNSALPPGDRKVLDDFYKDIANLWRVMDAGDEYFDELSKRTAYVQQALQQTFGATPEMKKQAQKLKEELEAIEFKFEGTPAKASWEEVPPEQMPLSNRFQNIIWASWSSSAGPTATQKMNYDILMEELPPVLEQLQNIDEQLKSMEAELDKMGAPYTPGRIPKLRN
jgi:DNA-binding protein YbaB